MRARTCINARKRTEFTFGTAPAPLLLLIFLLKITNKPVTINQLPITLFGLPSLKNPNPVRRNFWITKPR